MAYFPVRVASGRTTPGSTNWQPYTGAGGIPGAFVDVDTTSGGFTKAPVYITSLGGTTDHWAAIGATSIYVPTPTGFRVYVRWVNGAALSPSVANQSQWHINWIGMEF